MDNQFLCHSMLGNYMSRNFLNVFQTPALRTLLMRSRQSGRTPVNTSKSCFDPKLLGDSGIQCLHMVIYAVWQCLQRVQQSKLMTCSLLGLQSLMFKFRRPVGHNPIRRTTLPCGYVRPFCASLSLSRDSDSTGRNLHRSIWSSDPDFTLPKAT